MGVRESVTQLELIGIGVCRIGSIMPEMRPALGVHGLVAAEAAVVADRAGSFHGMGLRPKPAESRPHDDGIRTFHHGSAIHPNAKKTVFMTMASTYWAQPAGVGFEVPSGMIIASMVMAPANTNASVSPMTLPSTVALKTTEPGVTLAAMN